jgi:cobalt-zinc-cadmium efflux system outer membrane protein
VPNRAKSSFIALVFALGAFSPAAAEEPVLRLEELLHEVKEKNPALEAARSQARAMAAVPPQASALDDPTLSYEAWNIPESFRIDQADNNIFRLAQKFQFPGKRRLAGEVATHEAERSLYEASGVELDAVAAVKLAYYDLWEASERLEVFKREQSLLERFSRVAEQKYGVGEASQADVLRAQVELTHVINQLQTEPLEIEAARAELNFLLSRAPDGPLGRPMDPPRPSLPPSAAALSEDALAMRPELGAQKAAIAREETAEELAHKNYYPDFELSFGRFVNYGENDGFGAMASVTLPFANLSKYDAGVEEARAKLASARSERRRLEDRARRDVQQAFLKARRALLEYELFSTTHIPQAEQALRVAEGAYEAGEMGFLDLVDTLRRIESVHLEHVSAQADFERAYAELERMVGRELPRQDVPAHSRPPAHG